MRTLALSLLLVLAAQDAEPRSDARTIVAFGDSTTKERARVEAVYAQRLPALLEERGWTARVLNRGVGGDTTRRAFLRFERDVLRANPDLVLIQFGVNDSSIRVDQGETGPRVELADYLGYLTYFVRRLQQRDVDVILLTPNPLRWTPMMLRVLGNAPYDPADPWGLNVRNVAYADGLRALAERLDVPLVDVYAAHVEHDTVQGQSAGDLLLDGVHPNDDGHALVAVRVLDAIAEIWKP